MLFSGVFKPVRLCGCSAQTRVGAAAKPAITVGTGEARLGLGPRPACGRRLRRRHHDDIDVSFAAAPPGSRPPRRAPIIRVFHARDPVRGESRAARAALLGRVAAASFQESRSPRPRVCLPAGCLRLKAFCREVTVLTHNSDDLGRTSQVQEHAGAAHCELASKRSLPHGHRSLCYTSRCLK